MSLCYEYFFFISALIKSDTGAEGELIPMLGNDCAAPEQDGRCWQAGGMDTGRFWSSDSLLQLLTKISQTEPLLAWLRQTVTDYEAFIVAAR